MDKPELAEFPPGFLLLVSQRVMAYQSPYEVARQTQLPGTAFDP
jgi:hypothetical protein